MCVPSARRGCPRSGVPVPRLFPYACIHGVPEVRWPGFDWTIAQMIFNEFSPFENSRLGFVNELLMEYGGQLWGRVDSVMPQRWIWAAREFEQVTAMGSIIYSIELIQSKVLFFDFIESKGQYFTKILLYYYSIPDDFWLIDSNTRGKEKFEQQAPSFFEFFPEGRKSVHRSRSLGHSATLDSRTFSQYFWITLYTFHV